MGILQGTRRSWLALSVLGVLAACGSDSNEPAPYNAEGMTADVEATGEAFSAAEVQSFAYWGSEISAALGSEMAVLRTAAEFGTTASSQEKATAFARQLARSYSAGPRPSFSRASVPNEYLGKTFVWHAFDDEYVVDEERTGAPEDGVRFMLYAIDPLTGEPAGPVPTEVGYVDLTSTTTANGGTARILVKDLDGVTYLDYNFTGSATETAITMTVSGFATNGEERANFAMSFQITGGGEGEFSGFSVDYALEVPTRGFGIGAEIDLVAGSEGSDGVIQLELEARGANGQVVLAGDIANDGGVLTVHVNGELYATMTLTSSEDEPTITGPEGEALSESDLAALEAVFDAYGEAFEVLQDLLSPLGALATV